MELFLGICNKIVFVIGALLGLVASVVALCTNPSPRWILILLMISAIFFMLTFLTLLLKRIPVVTRSSGFGLVMFFGGSFAAFISALEAYLVDPVHPYLAFLRILLAGSVLLVIGSFGLLYDCFWLRMPALFTIIYLTITGGTTCLFVGSLLGFLAISLASKIVTLLAFAFLLLASVFNLWTPNVINVE